MFEKVKLGRASDKVVDQITHVIASGQLSPGDRLPSERELADRFGLSRMTVRDALRVLESRGLIAIKVGASGGAFVREPNLDLFTESLTTVIQSQKADYMELAEARKIVEMAVVELAAKRATRADIKAMKAAVEEGKLALEEERPMTEASVAFHAALGRASGNFILNLMMESFRAFFSDALDHILPDGARSPKGVKEHEIIAEAVAEGDTERAMEIMNRHLQRFEKMVRKFEERQKSVRAAESAG